MSVWQVAARNGLLTVVNRNTDQKTVFKISGELKTMVNRARDGKVRPDDIEGSTFTVSNLGMYDVDQFTAIINPPEAAILAVGSAREIPVVVEGEIKIASRMKATISVDHRVSDGAEGARFLQDWRSTSSRCVTVELPSSMNPWNKPAFCRGLSAEESCLRRMSWPMGQPPQGERATSTYSWMLLWLRHASSQSPRTGAGLIADLDLNQVGGSGMGEKAGSVSRYGEDVVASQGQETRRNMPTGMPTAAVHDASCCE
jgi:hypothetical protein